MATEVAAFVVCIKREREKVREARGKKKIIKYNTTLILVLINVASMEIL